MHKGRNIIERLDPSLHAGVKKVLSWAWDSPTAEQAERVLRNLARRLDHEAPGVSASILEGLDEILTVIRIGLPDRLRRSLGCTNAIESSDGRAAKGLPQRQTLARRTDGAAMDWNCDAGGREKLPPFEGPQGASDFEGRVAAPSASVARRQDCCQKKSSGIGFNQWRLLHQFQHAPGLSGHWCYHRYGTRSVHSSGVGLSYYYGAAPTEVVGIALVRHWGLLVFLVGVLLIYAAFHPEMREPITVVAAVEKIGFGLGILGTSLRRHPIAAGIAVGDTLIPIVYVLYLLGL